MSNRVVVIGAGHMGRALVAGIRGRSPADSLLVVETDAGRRRHCRQQHAVDVAETYDPLPGDTVLIAIPPHAFRQFSADYANTSFAGCLVLLVMARWRSAQDALIAEFTRWKERYGAAFDVEPDGTVHWFYEIIEITHRGGRSAPER